MKRIELEGAVDGMFHPDAIESINERLANVLGDITGSITLSRGVKEDGKIGYIVTAPDAMVDRLKPCTWIAIGAMIGQEDTKVRLMGLDSEKES